MVDVTVQSLPSPPPPHKRYTFPLGRGQGVSLVRTGQRPVYFPVLGPDVEMLPGTTLPPNRSVFAEGRAELLGSCPDAHTHLGRVDPLGSLPLAHSKENCVRT